MPDDSLAHRLVLRKDAVTQGWSDDELARLVRARDLERLRRGAYVDGPPPEDPALRHQLLVAAAVAGLRSAAVVSHQSAAVLHGFPLWDVPVTRVHVTRRPPARTASTRWLTVHAARLADEEDTRVRGIAVTGPVRTALDLARSLPFEAAVVALDGALRAGLVSADQLRARLFDIAGTPGSRAGARAVRFADGRSGGVGESRSRVLFHVLGLPAPALQHEVRTAEGRLVGRAPFGWEEQRVVGGFDGAVFQEKGQEDAVRAAGWSVLRWTWPDLDDPATLAARVRTALQQPC